MPRLRPHLPLFFLLALVSGARANPAAEPPLLGVEARFGGGLSLGGGAGVAVLRASPLTLGILADYAIRTDPWVSVYGGVFGETFNRAGIGLLGGLRLHLGNARFGGGVAAVIAPYTIFGPAASGGYCFPIKHWFRLCGDVEGTFYLIGSDLPDNRIAVQLQFLIGVLFDAM